MQIHYVPIEGQAAMGPNFLGVREQETIWLIKAKLSVLLIHCFIVLEVLCGQFKM